MPTRRQEKVASFIREIVSDAIRSLSDPRIIGFVSVTRVEVTADMRNASVFFSIFGTDEKGQKRTFDAIDHARKRIQAVLGQEMQSKFVPILSFHMDDKFKKMLETFKIIEQAADQQDQADEQNLKDEE